MADKRVQIPEEFWRLASAKYARSKAEWARMQTAEFGRKRTIISVDEDMALVIVFALDDYIRKHEAEYAEQKCEDCNHGSHWDGVVICDKDGQRHERDGGCSHDS